MTQTFAIVVHGTLPESYAALSALKFARAVIAGGHELYRVFFYHGGAGIAQLEGTTAPDELDLARQWLEFSSAHGVELAVCVGAAQRRGVNVESTPSDDASDNQMDTPQWPLVGLGQLLDAAMSCDHMITFPAR